MENAQMCRLDTTLPLLQFPTMGFEQRPGRRGPSDAALRRDSDATFLARRTLLVGLIEPAVARRRVFS
jgi:hypothetical protein